MRGVAVRALREAYRRELIPARVRWWMVAKGMLDWFRIVDKELRPHLGEASREVSAELAAATWRRRYRHLQEGGARLPDLDRDPRALARVMAALYRLELQPKARWLFSAVGGAPNALELVRGHREIAQLSALERWEEVTIHLGEWLIVLTEELPARLPRARQVVADICFRMGERYGERIRDLFGLPEDGNQPANAIEVLRMSEYIFRVNPEHWHEANATENRGYLEGNACPWFERPGWQQVHCGIFGQFQSGISSVFGLRYQLTKTIPKHGGQTCRIDLRPIKLRTKKDATN